MSILRFACGENRALHVRRKRRRGTDKGRELNSDLCATGLASTGLCRLDFRRRK